MKKGVAFLSVLMVSLLVPGPFSVAGFGGGQIQAGEQTADDVSFTLTSGWYPQPVQAGPEVKGHYVLMRGGVPYCELYISGRALAASETLDQAFQQGLETLKPGLPYYQARGTQRTKIAGTDAIVHEMSYNPSSGVSFVGRAYCLIANASVYTFFFNTTSTYFFSLQGSFQQIMSTVRIGAPVAAGAAGGAPFAGGRAGAAPMPCEDYGLSYDLPAGWAPSNDAAGAKYRIYGSGGMLIASLFPFKPVDDASTLTGLFGDPAGALDIALKGQQDGLFKEFGNYTPTHTAKFKIGGLDALLHDFTFQQGATKGFYRWYFISVKDTPDTATTRYAPRVHMFAFMTTGLNQLEALKAQFESIAKTFRMKGEPPPKPEPQAAAGAGSVALPTPVKPLSGLALPALGGARGNEPGTFSDPLGRFKIALPTGARLTGKDETSSSYELKAQKATLQIWAARTAGDAERIHATATRGKTPNGEAVNGNVGARNVIIRLYAGKDAAGEDKALVSAIFPAEGLLLSIELPARDYAGAQAWILDFVQSVQFLR